MTARFNPDDLPPELEAVLHELPTLDELLKGLPDFKKSIADQHAVLDENGEVQIVGSFLDWANWFERNHHQRVIGREEIMRTGEAMVPELYVCSTVFLGLNHQYLPGRPALWFETIVFAPPVLKYYKTLGGWRTASEDLWMRRCSTRAQAFAQHTKGLEWLRAYIAALDAKREAYSYEPTS